MLGFGWPVPDWTGGSETGLVVGLVAYALLTALGVLYAVFVERARKRMAPPAEEPKTFLEAA